MNNNVKTLLSVGVGFVLGAIIREKEISDLNGKIALTEIKYKAATFVAKEGLEINECLLKALKQRSSENKVQ